MAGFTNRALQAKEKIFQTLFGFDNMSLVSHSNIKKNIVSFTFNGNQSMNKISYLWLEWNPNSLVAKLTA